MKENSSKKCSSNNEWKRARRISKKEAAEIVVKKISKVLAISAVIALAAKAGYEYGYNSDFAQHFWDNTKANLEEQRKEREALKPKILNGISIQDDDGERE